jgi:hypothetical protein
VDVEHDNPRAHLVVDNFFSEAALAVIFAEVAKLEPKLKPGLVRAIGHDGQSVFFDSARRKNRAVWIHEGSKTLRLFRETLWAPALVRVYDQAREPLFQIIPNCWAPHLQVSSYMTGDRYEFHEDEGAGVNLTAVVFLATNPTKVRGGDLVLSYRGAQKTIRFRHNRLVIFPSKTLHRVTPVKVDSQDVRHARISLQCWLAPGAAPHATQTKLPRKDAEADVPTFLLAEESIIAGAQALITRPGGPATSPDTLYWGAFYLSRILTANLRYLVSAQEQSPALGAIRVRQREGLEVYGTLPGAITRRVGFRIRGGVSPSEAVSLFVERGRGAGRVHEERVVYAGMEVRDAVSLLARMLAGPPRERVKLKEGDRVAQPPIRRTPPG